MISGDRGTRAEGEIRAHFPVLTCSTVAVTFNAGLRNYVLHGMGCHGAGGDGVSGKIPPLKAALGLFIRSNAGRQFIVRVPGASTSALTDAELAAVTNMMLRRFNANERPDDFVPYTAAEVTRL